MMKRLWITYLDLNLKTFYLPAEKDYNRYDETGKSVDHKICDAGSGPNDCKPKGPDMDLQLDRTGLKSQLGRVECVN